MELDALQSPVLGADGAVQDALGTRAPLARAPVNDTGVTTGMDDSLRALLAEAPGARTVLRSESPARGNTTAPATSGASNAEPAYSADPLKNGIACYRAGRYGEALELLAPLDGAAALYWKARTLERLERLDDAVDAMERALAAGKGKDAAGFEERRASTDLDFLRWKRDFVKGLPAHKEAPR